MKKVIISMVLAITMLVGCSQDQENEVNEPVLIEDVETTETSIEMFTSRDLTQEVDVSEATIIEIADEQTYEIEEVGVYVLTGNGQNVSIVVNAADEKVQLVLEGLMIENTDKPVIEVVDADKVFITTTKSVSELKVINNFEESDKDSVIFSNDDLVFNGRGSLTIISDYGNGITSKDDLKITGSSLYVSSSLDAIEANDSIRIYDGSIRVNSLKDGLHTENDSQDKGYIYITGGLLEIAAEDDGIMASSIIEIHGGEIGVSKSSEGLEANQIYIYDGSLNIVSSDDGINATSKVGLDVLVEIYDGDIYIEMAEGDTDAIDSNGDLYVYGGNITLKCGSSFDADGTAELIDGYVLVNGEEITEITTQHQGGSKKH